MHLEVIDFVLRTALKEVERLVLYYENKQSIFGRFIDALDVRQEDRQHAEQQARGSAGNADYLESVTIQKQ
jgi:hypothetical protein